MFKKQTIHLLCFSFIRNQQEKDIGGTGLNKPDRTGLDGLPVITPSSGRPTGLKCAPTACPWRFHPWIVLFHIANYQLKLITHYLWDNKNTKINKIDGWEPFEWQISRSPVPASSLEKDMLWFHEDKHSVASSSWPICILLLFSCSQIPRFQSTKYTNKWTVGRVTAHVLLKSKHIFVLLI
jgi:hypothetical protein